MAQIVTITNPLTGQPAQVDQLDYTAQQIDDGLNIARGVSNPNLLDNWYFGNPVDQRGGYVVPPNTSYYANDTGALVGTTDKYYTVDSRVSDKAYFAKDGAVYNVPISAAVRGYTGAGYGIDRWFLSNADGSVLVEDTGVRLTVTNTCNFAQSLPLSLAGETVTLSVLAEDVSGPAYLSIRAENFGWMEDGSRVAIQTGLTTLTFTVASSRTANKKVCISNIDDTSQVSVKIKAVKLELGTQQTLAHQDANGKWVLNELPNYADTLARCRYYCRRLKSSNPNQIIGEATNPSSTAACVVFPFAMRNLPTVALKGNFKYCIQNAGSQTEYPISGASVVGYNTEQIWVNFTISGAPAFNKGIVRCANDSTAELIFSADL